MQIRISILLLVILTSLSNCSTNETIVHVDLSTPSFEHTQPKMVIGITVDQMRFDYLTKYWDDYSETGFKRLISEGFLCKNHHFSYAPTYTGPGHASIYTGTTPAVHGIVGNNWYDRSTKSGVYCSGDSTVFGIGDTTLAGKMSPRNMFTTTMTDELKLYSNMRSKTIGISMKDRGAILPAGHLADAAYWFIGGTQGDFITSSYYMDELPEWVSSFNNSNRVDSLLQNGWDLFKERSAYDESITDNNQYEEPFVGKLQPTFPYDFSLLADSNGVANLVKGSPLGNELLTEFAISCIDNENMGMGEQTDFLALSYSSTDYVGHRFAPAAMESQDCYLRLDHDISKLLKHLDSKLGEGTYTVFLTADHGAVHNPNYLKKVGAPAGYFKGDVVTQFIDSAVYKKYGITGMIESYSNNQVFLNDSLINANSLNKTEVENLVMNASIQYEGVHISMTRTQLLEADFTSGIQEIIQEGFNQKLSGDVFIVPRPGWLSYPTTGTSHGSPFSYDTHVPLILFGKGVYPGFTDEKTFIKDIAPTVCSILGIQMPNGTTGSPIVPALQNN